MTPQLLLSSKQLVKLHKLFNYYTEEELNESMKSAVFYHLTPYYVDRPWKDGNAHPIKDLYESYLSQTYWHTKLDSTPTSYLPVWQKQLFIKTPFYVYFSLINIRKLIITNPLLRKLLGKSKR
jgi:hypothetical protein